MTISRFKTNFRTFIKPLILGLSVVASQSCSDEDTPAETKPIEVHKYQGSGNGASINVQDSLITIYSGSGVVASEIIISVRSTDLKKGNDIIFISQALSESNMGSVRSGLLYLQDSDKNTQILPSATKYLASSSTKRIDEININKMGIVGLYGGLNGDDTAITKEQVQGILAKAAQSAALVGNELYIGQEKIKLKPTND